MTGGSLQIDGLSQEPPSSYLYGPNGWVGVGAGLSVNAEGNLEVSVIPCDYPPYGCNTSVNPYCVTDFTQAWKYCSNLTSFPLLDVSNGTNFSSSWFNCNSLTSFPAGMFDTCSATNFTNTWRFCALNQTSVDNILVSIDTAGQFNGTLGIDNGTSSPPGPAGLAAKANLITRGWTVTTN